MGNFYQPKDWRTQALIEREKQSQTNTLGYGGLPTYQIPQPQDPFGRFLGTLTPEYAKRFAAQPPEAIRRPTPQQLKDQLAVFGESAATILPVPLPWGKIGQGLKWAAKTDVWGGKAARVIPKVAQVIPDSELPSAINEIKQFLTAAKESLPETKLLRTAERKARVAAGARALEYKGFANEEAFIKAKAALKGRLPTAPLQGELPVITPEKYGEVLTFIRNTPKLRFFERVSLEDALNTLLINHEGIQKNQIKLLSKTLGIEAELLKKLGWAKFWENTLQASGLPRAVLTSIDVSGSLRQGVVLSARRPFLWAKSQGPMFKALFSEKYATQRYQNIVTDPLYKIATESRPSAHKLFIASLDGDLAKAEEVFMSKFIKYIPGVRASARAYITVLNDLRFGHFKETYKVWEKMGVANEKNLNWLATLINTASGRGTMGFLAGTPIKEIQGAAPILNQVVFSPRLFLARWQYPAMLLDPRIPKHVRIEQMKQLISFLGVGTGTVSLLKLSGFADVETDPRSADFMKARIGKTRLDIWGGFQQYVRFTTQMVTMQRKTATGEIQDVSRDELIFNFAQSKFSPLMGLFWDLMRGKTYMGEELSLEPKKLGMQVRNRLMPLFIQDMIDAYVDLGLMGLGVAAPGAFGVGVTTYGTTPSTSTRKRIPSRTTRGGTVRKRIPRR